MSNTPFADLQGQSGIRTEGTETVHAGRHETQHEPDGYGFLLDSGLPTAVLIDAVDNARRWDVSVADALLARGGLDDARYAALVARALRLPHIAVASVTSEPALLRIGRFQVRRLRDPVVGAGAGRPTYLLAATAGPLNVLEEAAQAIRAFGADVAIVSPRVLAAAIERAGRSRAVRRAIHSLRMSSPTLSASRPFGRWQVILLVMSVVLFSAACFIEPRYALAWFLAALLLPFLAVVAVRSLALAMLWAPEAVAAAPVPVADTGLPVYSVLVPLFDEAAVVPGLIRALSALDYPTAKLDVTLVLEETDLTTKLALLDLSLPANFELIVVPDSRLRTKPKALNYAMQFARGDFVVIYDAEDRPEPDQLRKAVAAFRDGPVNLACVQARLNLYNPRDSWLARQFTLEYSALFDAILPALAWLNLPVPLGGTSNHFPRPLLDQIGGWDPFNVTEDADLGIRLARLGYVTQILDSTTWEEAPVSWSQWLPQRTRWLKGWYQTYLVHNRDPGDLLRDLGWRRTLGFHVFLGGVILSTLLHPFAYALLASAIFGVSMLPSILTDAAVLWAASMVTLGLGYGSAIAVGIITGRRRGHGLGWSALWLPIYWLLVSVAAYRAVWQLLFDPFRWEKTKHGQARSDVRVAAPHALSPAPQPARRPL